MKEFSAMHYEEDLLILFNVWDVPSIKVAEQNGYKAIATSSSAISHMLGLEDGEQMQIADLIYLVRFLIKSTNLPLSVDIEAGYRRDASEITENILQLIDLGVVGINIEDSIVEKERELMDAELFASTIEKVKTNLTKINKDIFLNARLDTYLLNCNDKFEQSKRRIQLYEAAGADGVFIPCLTDLTEMKQLTDSTKLPLNIMCMPGLANFQMLKEAGVKRISMGNFMHDRMYSELSSLASKVKSEQSFKSIA